MKRLKNASRSSSRYNLRCNQIRSYAISSIGNETELEVLMPSIIDKAFYGELV